MNKTKIEWCDYTFNPVTGCLHGCSYCYARRIAERFHNHEANCTPVYGHRGCYNSSDGIPFPAGFAPTFYHNHLEEPQRVKKSQKIFVVSMGDLFGNWVPDEWIQQVFDACAKAPQHKYLFLTKNGEKYSQMMRNDEFPNGDNFWFGNTITSQSDFKWAWAKHHFYSIEPLLSPIDLNEVFDEDNGTRYIDCVQWVIIGAETGNRKDKVIPKREWVDCIVNDCRAAGVPVFMKDSLRELMGTDFVQEWPDGLK